MFPPHITIRHAGLLALCVSALPCHAQDIEPRRWSHLPLGGHFGGMAYAYTEGDIFLNPVLRIEDGELHPFSASPHKPSLKGSRRYCLQKPIVIASQST